MAIDTGKSATSLARMFDILDLISIDNPVLRADDVCRALGYTRATGYRYLKALCDAGLLALAGGGVYTLGPRILELERLQTLTDPLLRASHDVTVRLAKASPRSSFLVCSLYRDKVLCIHQEGATRFTAHGRIIPLLRAKGLPMPLFSGAASLAILASLPLHRIKSLYLDKEAEIATAGLGTNWRAFRASVAEMRKTGYAATTGQMSPDLMGIAAPIPAADGQVVGSLCRVLLRDDAATQDTEALGQQIIAAAAKIGACLDAEVTGTNSAAASAALTAGA